MALVRRPADAEIDKQRHTVHGGGPLQRHRPIERADRCSDANVLGGMGLAGPRVGVLDGAAHDGKTADREM